MKKEELEGQQTEQIWKFYERMKESVCVVDMDSHELVYANRHARKIYGIGPMEESKGKKCYELLKGSSIPCTACNHKKLTPGFFLEEVRYNPVIKKKLALKETIIEENGKHYRFELGVDLSAWEQQNKGYEDNEAMINEGLRIAMLESVPEDSIAALLEYLGQSLASDRVYIFEEMEDGAFRNTYEWCAGGVTPQKENLQNVSFQVVRIWKAPGKRINRFTTIWNRRIFIRLWSARLSEKVKLSDFTEWITRRNNFWSILQRCCGFWDILSLRFCTGEIMCAVWKNCAFRTS